ncbi:LysR family transcriptional regulator [Acidihalobacter prosperus]|uniref:Transcriptional regulator n=1 Tax=Acidihalobacter prosperus TaxID=160660 RepID=A0A1A6C3N2_9GAMM|nr:LysR family transcriptional regulator [Acidihalobacter prosperus]OBS09168.1 transcriptional regulator [Acidihalobacter prosperus]
MTNWEDLRHFLAVAQAGSLSGAARTLKVDHATVSRRLAALERRLEARLVERLPRECRLTATGERVYALASEIESQAFAIDRIARGEQAQLKGEVTVSATPMTVEAILAVRLGDFRRRYPGIQLSLSAQNLFVSLTRREADIAVRMDAPGEQNNVARKLGQIPFALYSSRDYPHLDRPEAWEFIFYDAQFESVSNQQWLIQAAGTREVACRVSTTAGQQAAARAGAGVANLPCFLGDADEQLVRLPFDGEAHMPDLWLVVHSDLRRSAPVRAVMDYLVEVFAEFCEVAVDRGA